MALLERVSRRATPVRKCPSPPRTRKHPKYHLEGWCRLWDSAPPPPPTSGSSKPSWWEVAAEYTAIVAVSLGVALCTPECELGAAILIGLDATGAGLEGYNLFQE